MWDMSFIHDEKLMKRISKMTRHSVVVRFGLNKDNRPALLLNWRHHPSSSKRTEEEKKNGTLYFKRVIIPNHWFTQFAGELKEWQKRQQRGATTIHARRI